MTTRDELLEDADNHYNVTRELCRAFTHGAAPVLPAPTVYRLLGNLKSSAGYAQSEILRAIAPGLLKSLDAFDVTDDGDPSTNAMTAADLINQAADLAHQIGQLLDAAQSAIASQGYTGESA